MLMRLFSLGAILSVCSIAQGQDQERAEDASTLDVTVVESSPAPAVPNPVMTQRRAAPKPPAEKIRNSSATPEVPTVVATKTPKAEPQLIPSVDTLAVSELRQNQRFTAANFLRFAPGTSVVQTGQGGAVTSLFVRGMESDHTVVLLNGRRLPPGLAGQYQLEFLDISLLESVQLHRGPVSSLYGSDAVAGALDLRMTDARFVETNGLSSYFEGGSFSTFRNGTTVTFRENRFGGVLELATVSTENDRPESDFENRTLRGNFAFDVAEGIWFDVLGNVQAASIQVPGSSFNNPNFPENQLNENQSMLVSPRLTVERDNWDFSTFYSYSENVLEATQTLFLNDNLLEQTGHEAEAVFHFRPGEDATYTLGSGYYEYQFDRSPLTPGFFNQPANFRYSYGSVFGQADIDLPADFNVVTSIRHDSHDTYRDATTYSVQLSHHLESTGSTLFGKIATGYKAPVGQDLLFTLPGVDLSTIEPEESHSWEVGIRQDLFGKRGSLGLTWFHNDIENLIDNDPFTFVFSQVDAETEGLEVEAEMKLTEELDFYANYTWLDARVVGGAGFAGLPGDRLLRRPRHTVNAGLVWSTDRFDLGAEIQGGFDRIDGPAFGTNEPFFADDYMIARLFGSRQITDRWEIYGRIENLFDERYVYTRGFEAAGFGIFGGVRISTGD